MRMYEYALGGQLFLSYHQSDYNPYQGLQQFRDHDIGSKSLLTSATSCNVLEAGL